MNTEIKPLSPELPMDQKEIKGEIEKYIETNETGNTTYQNLWDTANPVLRGKLIIINTYIKKQKISNKQANYASRNWKIKLNSKLAEGRK